MIIFGLFKTTLGITKGGQDKAGIFVVYIFSWGFANKLRH